MADYIVANEQTLTGLTFGFGDTIVVQAGGTLSDSMIPRNVASVTMEAGAILEGTIRTAKEISTSGSVDASQAVLILDISERKPEEAIMVPDWPLLNAKSLSVIVDSDQDKGMYRLAGNATEFNGTITVMNPLGTELGILSLEEPDLDFDITHYSLGLNASNELCLTVSSNIPDTDDYVLLYKDSELVATSKSVDGITISRNGEYDHMIVLKNGIANQVELSAGGTLAVYSGATVTGLTQSGGILSFDYTGSDTTIITGTNKWGEFSVQNGVATNLSAQGKITLHDAELKNLRDGSVSVYGGSATGDIAGSIYLRDQATGTGINFNGSVLELEHAGVQDSTIMSGELKLLDRSSAESIVVENGSLTIWGDGSALGNITVKNGASFNLEGSAALTGDLFLSGPLSIKSYSYYWNGSDQSYWQLIGQSGFLDANGHTITFDMTGKKTEEEALIAYMKAVSEDAKYKLVFSDTQRFGKYAIAEKVWSFVDVFSITVNGTDVGTLSKEQTSLEYGNYRYEMQYDQLSQKLDLVISVSDNAGPEYGILYYDSEDEFHHTNALSSITVGSSVYWDMTVRTGGYLEDSILEGGNLRVYSGATVTGLTQSGGTLSFDYTGTDTTIITGTNQWGEFSVQNGVAANLSAQGKITLHDAELKNLRDGSVSVYGGRATGDIAGSIYLRDQATGTGINFNGSVLELERAGVQDSTIMSGELKLLDRSSAESIVVENGKLTIWGDGSTLGNITVKNGASFNLEGSATLNGDLFLSGPLNVQSGSYHWNGSDQSYWQSIGLSGFLDANGHTITFDMTGKKPEEEALIAYMTAISEDVNYKLVFSDSPSFGTYSIAKKVGSFVDSFIITVDETDIGVLNKDQSFVENGVYRYEMKHDALNQTLDLVISVSDNAGPEYGILYYDSEDEFHHTNALSSITVGSSVYWDMTVRVGGYLEDSILNGGSLSVYSGATVTGLTQSGGILSFDYTGSDTTIITGTNKWGEFSVQNGVATNLSAQGKITLHDAELKNLRDGSVSVYGGSATGDIAGSVYLRDQATGTGINFNGSVLELEHAGVQDSTIMSGELKLLDRSSAESIVVENGSLTIWGDGSTLGNITVKNGASFNLEGSATLNGDLFLSGPLNVQSVSYHWNGSDQSYWQSIGQSGFLDANGHTITFDASAQSTIPNDIFSQYLESIVNAEFVLQIKHDTAIGSYLLAEHSGRFGQGNTKGIWDADTNTWKYQGAVYGDMDGVIEIRDENGILLANCTVNGDTEYFGRYNYTVRVDNSGDMYLDVGWNTREGRTYAADGLDNLTLATAAALPEVGTKLTIDSADDVDWFKFALATPGRKSSYIGIEFKQWAGDLDLYLYDADGNQLDYAKSVTDNERISLKGLAAGDYYVKVEGYEGNVNEYKLAYKLPEQVVLTDEYELGNTPFSAVPLWTITGTKTVGAAIQTAEDVDYYSFVLTRKGTTADSVTLTFDTDFGDLDLYLFDVSGIFLLGKSISTDSGTETISLAGLKSGLYVAKVISKDGITVANYDLTFNVREKEVEPDKYENNNSMKRATDLHTPNEAGSINGLSIHSDTDVDYYEFSLLEKGSADDWIGISYEVSMGDLDLEILNAVGEVVAYSWTAENEDMVSLKGFEVGNYYIRVSGYNNVANNYTLNWNVTNSSLIPSDSYEGVEPVAIRENQTITGLSIAKPVKEDETRADTFRIVLEYDAWKRSKIILTDYRSDWEEGMKYVIKDADGNILKEGTDSEISLYGLKKGEYDLTVDAPNENEYSEYSLIAQSLPDSDNPKDNTWSFFIYMAGDNNLEGCYLTELLYMQSAILPENVEVYVLLDRHEGWSTAQRDWTDTRVGKIRHSKGGAIAVEWMYFDGVNTNTYMNTQNLDLKKEWDTGKISTLEAFLDWGMQVGRAENYALIMKDHGSSLGYNCQDDESGSILAIDEIADLLRADKYKDLSVVAFDQCLMGSDVVISTMEGTVDYVVASEAVGYTPNLLVMYKVLLNSLETEMTPQEVSQKIVAACNCSGVVKLTMASFKTDEHALSEALQAFGEAAKGFTREDWVAICKSFATAYNYGDEFWAYSDLGSFLSTLKEYSTSISGTLMNATETLYDVVLNQLLDSTMITPTIYGSGLAVFNPVLSNDVISFYATGIGQTAWGDFLYTAGQIAEDCTEYFVDTRTNLTFTDFSYSIEDEAVLVTYNLGTFYGNGVEYNGLYVDKKACFTVSLDQAGIDGDAIHVVADNPDANITIALIQKVYPLFGDPIKTARRTSTDGILSLAGVDPAKAGVDTEYDLVITSDRETTYSLSFVADWTSGSDFFDYTRSGSLGAQGNGSIDKATKLAAGNYGGLVTYAGDPDFYQLNTVYSDTLSVTVNGSGLTVQEYDVDGLLVQGAEYADGKYTIIVANGNYLRVEGNADLAAKEVNSYSLYISDVSSTYLSLGGTEIQLPEKPVVMDELKDNQVTVTLNMEAGMKGYSSDDLQTWTECENDSFVATQNGQYYFKSVNPETELESKYTSLRVVGIDNVLPTVSNVKADVITPTNGNVIVTAEFADDVQLDVAQYRIDEGGKWLDYVDGVTVSENATVYFRAIDVAGNTSAIVPYDVTNIDKALPTVSNVQADITVPTNQAVTVTATFADNVELKQSLYKIGDGGIWSDYVDGVIVTDNTTVYFKAVDTAGNEAEEAYAVGNIDRDTPVIVVSGDNTTPLKASSLTVTTEAGLDILYSTDNQTWTKYTGEIAVSANATYYFKVTDAAGNVGTAEFTFTNIDTIAPEAPIVSADITDATNQNVTVTAVFSDDSAEKEYSLDGTTWLAYTVPIIFEENGNVSFRSMDAAGNISATTSCTVGNIDKIAPDKPTASADVTAPTNTDVLVSAVFSADSIVKEYSLDGETWQAYTAAIKFADNDSVYFRGTDEAGNVSEVTMYAVSNIDKIAPEKPSVTADITTPTNTDVLVSAQFSDDSVKKEYSFDGQTWKAYTAAIRFAENGTVYFRGTDAADNVSDVASYTVANINKVAPDKPVATIDVTAPTNTAVHVSAIFNENSVLNEYSLNGTDWLEYIGSIEFTENGPVYFRSRDNAGNISEVTAYEVTNIDKVAPEAPVASVDVTTATNGNVLVSAIFSDDSVVKEYSLDGQIWMTYDEAVVFTENGSVMFRGTDEAGNVSAETKYEVTNIDKTEPVIDLVGDFTTPLQASTLAATTEAGLDIYWSTDNETWTRYEVPLSIASNGTYFFKTTDPANNTGTASITFANIDTIAPVITLTGDNITPLQQTTLTATVDDGSPIYYRIGDSGEWLEYKEPITVTDNATYNFLATDTAGNEGTNFLSFANIIQAPISDVVPQTQTWEKVEEATQYIVEYSTDNFEHVIQLVVDSNSLDSFQMPAGNYQMRVKPEGGEWSEPEPVDATKTATEPKLVKSNADGNADVFFANPIGTWESGYVAQHVGSINDWSGTNEYASVCGKNKLADIIEGSTDANILLMTDDDNGDSLFVDDIYTTLPGSVTEQQSRIAQIDEIRAGAGDDIVDMTSQRFEYVGDGLTIRGGVGNDVIWASKGDNFLFGDAGNDRIVGASGNDVIAGGIGNDRMHGGGGSDIFTFGGSNWGEDTVEQLATGSVTLWFASGSMDNWDNASLTYRDGDNCVKVIGTTSIELRFGNDDSDMYKDLVSAGAFEEFTSERIFEESGKGILASL